MTPQELLLYTEEEIAQQLAEMATRERIKQNITQKSFAEKAGIPFATYRKFEQTGKISLQGFLKVLRHLGILKELTAMIDRDSIEKLGADEFVKLNKIKERKRAGS